MEKVISDNFSTFGDAILEACDSESWHGLLTAIQKLSATELKDQGYNRYSDLSQEQQIAFVEKTFFDMQQSRHHKLLNFNARLNKAVDEELLKLIGNQSMSKNQSHNKTKNEHNRSANLSNNNIIKHESDVDYLIQYSSQSIHEILETSSPEFSSAAKLFLNRSLPVSERPFIWYSCLDIGNVPMISKGATGRLAYSLDQTLSRRCLEILDAYFVKDSSRANAALVKTAVATFMRNNDIPLPYNDKGYDNTDRLVFILVPLVRALRKNNTNNDGNVQSKETELKLSWSPTKNDKPDPQTLDKALTSMMGGAHLNQLSTAPLVHPSVSLEANYSSTLTSVSAGGITSTTSGVTNKSGHKGLITRSNCLGYLTSMVEEMDSDLWYHLQTLEAPSLMSEYVLSQEESENENENENEIDPNNADDSKRSEVNKRSSSSGSDLLGWNGCKSFEDFLNSLLLRALSGLLQEDVLLFVWDQCFICKSFDKMLPVIICALLGGAAEEIKKLKNVKSAIQSFVSYGQRIDVNHLQRLITVHCSKSLHDMFEIEGNYSLGISNDGVLQAIYRRLMPVSTEEDYAYEESRAKRKKNRRKVKGAARAIGKLQKMKKKMGTDTTRDVDDDRVNQEDDIDYDDDDDEEEENFGVISNNTPVPKLDLDSMDQSKSTVLPQRKQSSRVGELIRRSSVSIANLFAFSPRSRKTILEEEANQPASNATPRRKSIVERIRSMSMMSPRSKATEGIAIDNILGGSIEEMVEGVQKAGDAATSMKESFIGGIESVQKAGDAITSMKKSVKSLDFSEILDVGKDVMGGITDGRRHTEISPRNDAGKNVEKNRRSSIAQFLGLSPRTKEEETPLKKANEDSSGDDKGDGSEEEEPPILARMRKGSIMRSAKSASIERQATNTTMSSTTIKEEDERDSTNGSDKSMNADDANNADNTHDDTHTNPDEVEDERVTSVEGIRGNGENDNSNGDTIIFK